MPRRQEVPDECDRREPLAGGLCSQGRVPWKKWGPYVSERQWGTVREDYSADGHAWDHLTHDQSRSRAYRWGEDGLGGICDDKQRLCFAPGAVERPRSHPEGAPVRRHQRGGQPRRGRQGVLLLRRQHAHPLVHEVHLQVPAGGVPYTNLSETSKSRSRQEWEYELLDTGVFADNRYFDVVVEYAKASPDDVLIRISAFNRGPDAAPLHVCPLSGFATPGPGAPTARKPQAPASGRAAMASPGFRSDTPSWVNTSSTSRARCRCCSRERDQPAAAVRKAQPRLVRQGRLPRIRDPGTAGRDQPGADRHKAAAHYQQEVAPGQAAVIRLRLTRGNAGSVPELSQTRVRRRAGRSGVRRRRLLRCASAPRSGHRPAVGDAAGAVRDVVEQAVLLLRSRSLAGRTQPPAGRRSATATGTTWSTTTSCRCRTNGNTPGTRPGISLSTRSRWAWSIPLSPVTRSS